MNIQITPSQYIALKDLLVFCKSDAKDTFDDPLWHVGVGEILGPDIAVKMMTFKFVNLVIIDNSDAKIPTNM